MRGTDWVPAQRRTESPVAFLIGNGGIKVLDVFGKFWKEIERGSVRLGTERLVAVEGRLSEALRSVMVLETEPGILQWGYVQGISMRRCLS